MTSRREATSVEMIIYGSDSGSDAGAVFVAIAVRVIMRRPVRGVALSWLLLVAALPLAGALVYLLIGERRIGRKRSHRINSLRADFRQIAKATIPADFSAIDWSELPAAAQAMDRLGDRWSAAPRSAATISSSSPIRRRFLPRLCATSTRQSTSVLMEFYIWNEGGARTTSSRRSFAQPAAACSATC